jgi:LysM repeat protein
MLAFLLMLFSFRATAQEASASMIALAARPPDYYAIQQGDTLWEISSTFMGNPYYWPQLWSINEQVTNPHWIYPGNRIVFRAGTVLSPPELTLEAGESGRDGYVVKSYDYERVPAECGPDSRFATTVPADKYQSLLFISKEDDLSVFGEMKKARLRSTILSERDTVYLDVEDPDAFECGDMVQLFKKDPVYDNRYYKVKKLDAGTLYKVVADVQIVHKYKKMLVGIVRTSYIEVERSTKRLTRGNEGHTYVGPMRPVTVELELAPPKGDLEGHIVSKSTSEKDSLDVGDTVFVDRGRNDGVRVGNTFYVVEQADELLDQSDPPALVEKEDENLPFTVVGRLVIVRVDDLVSTAVITDAITSLRVGQQVSEFVK